MIKRMFEDLTEDKDPRNLPGMFNDANQHFDRFKKHANSPFRKRLADQHYVKAVAASEEIAQTLIDLGEPKKPTDYANHADLLILRSKLNILPNNITLLAELGRIIESAKASGFLPVPDRDENWPPSRLEGVEMLYVELKKQDTQDRIAKLGLHLLQDEDA